MAIKLLIGLFSFTIVNCLPLSVFANTTDSTRIGINVVVKATQNCQFQFLPINYSHSNQTHYANCELESKILQQNADQVALQIDQKLILNELNEKLLRVVMTIQ